MPSSIDRLSNEHPGSASANLLKGKLLPLKAAAQALRKNPQTLRRWGQRALDPLPIYRLGRDEYVHVDVSFDWMLRQRQRPADEVKLGRRPGKRHA